MNRYTWASIAVTILGMVIVGALTNWIGAFLFLALLASTWHFGVVRYRDGFRDGRASAQTTVTLPDLTTLSGPITVRGTGVIIQGQRDHR